MFTSFDEKTFRNAIAEKDYLRLKVNTVSSMRDDPTFARGETEKVLEILEKNVPEIFEDEIRLDYEERPEPDAWDKRYFTKLTYWFQENFAKSRVEHIKEVGRAVHKDTARKYEESLKKGSLRQGEEPGGKRSAQAGPTTQAGKERGRGERCQDPNPSKAPTAKEREIPAAGVIAAIAVVVLVVVMLLKLASR